MEKFIGDAVMALFGAPVAHEDDPERAVRAALAIRTRSRLRDGRPGLDLHVRIGVNTGEALVALGARPERGRGDGAGDVVNTAARLQAAAPVDGDRWSASATYRATAPRDRVREPAEPVDAKGKARAGRRCGEAVAPRARFGVDVDAGTAAAARRPRARSSAMLARRARAAHAASARRSS